MTRILFHSRLDDCLAAWRAAGFGIVAPTRNCDVTSFAEVRQASEIDLESILPDRSVKELFFPQTEPILRYQIGKQSADAQEVRPEEGKRIIFGVRPCDACGLDIDDALFSWDYRDEYWLGRRDRAVIVTIACTKSDDFCMCTSLQLSPDNPKGSDLLLQPLSDGKGWTVQPISERGTAAVELIAPILQEGEAATAPPAAVPIRFDLERAAAWLADRSSFESPFWKEISQRCIGCGSCTFLCPTCHCFDIQDEGDTYGGTRRKNWDSCSFAMFTMHTSGHNPRNTRSARWRQRIMHKFNYFHGKFGVNSCSGCGRCTRQCPVDMGITETLQAISNLPK